MDAREQESRFTFGVFDFDTRAGELRKRGARVRLNGQPVEILAALLVRAGDVVSRDELRQRLWPGDDTFVDFDHSLNTAVKRLREALGDDASMPRFIETIPRRGYRFVAPVERVKGDGLRGDLAIADPQTPIADPVPAPVPGANANAAAGATTAADAVADAAADAADAATTPPRQRRRILRLAAATIAAACAAVLVVVAAAGLWWRPSPPAAAAAPAESGSGRLRLAVLPFANLTGDAGRQYVAEGLTEELVSQLGRLAPARLAVIARSSTAWPDGARPPLREIARALQVDYVIEGSVRSVDDRYRIAARLVETQALSTLWSELYEGPILEVADVERRVSMQVGRQLALAVAPADSAVIARATTSSSPAFEAYLRGLYQLARGPEEGFRESVRLFQRAIELDPGYALAYAGLSEAHLRLQDYYLVDPAQSLAPARAAALKALELDERIAEAHCALGDVLSTTRDMTGAERAFQRALALNPSHAASYERYAWHLTRVGRAAEARTLIERARALAPRSADVATAAAYFDFESDRLDSAAALASAALTYEPEYPFARYVLGRIALKRGTPAVAIDEFSRARFASRDAPKYLGALVSAYLAAGRIDDAARTLDELRVIARTRFVPPDMIELLDARVAARTGT